MTAKDLVLKPIDARRANAVVRRLHYSGKVDTRSQLHIGVYLDGQLEGALQFGPSIDKRKTIGLVSGTGWNEYLELNRLALSDRLPRNSESRAIAVTMRLLRKHAPHLRWILSYADATQCGDGTIYRASGFVLTSIKRNTSMVRMPDGKVYAKLVFSSSFGGSVDGGVKARYGKRPSEGVAAFFRRIGAELLPGYQLRYIYFPDPSARQYPTVPEIPYEETPAAARPPRG